MSRRIFTGTSHFPTLRENEAVYVDKTEFIYHMAQADKAFFLSRPRRFGKSLLITTMEAYFQGRKELFEGLAIEKLEKDWIKHPVLRFDMSGTRYASLDDLEERINVILTPYEEIYGRTDNLGNKPNTRVGDLIRRAKTQTGQNVVILIDEYDAPLLDTVMDGKSFAELRQMLRSFYSPLKESGEHLRFVFLTGITKFSQLSIFSELNNLKKVSMDDRYSTICGITEEEIRNSLAPEVETLAEKYGVDFETAMSMLKKQYDGYHFSKNSPNLYNPYSLLNCLQDQELNNYWFASGTSTHLTEMLSRYSLRPEELEGFYLRAEAFDAPTEKAESPIPILYQSGYLTIKEARGNLYKLGFPNEEVRIGFLMGLFPFYSKTSSNDNEIFLAKLTIAFEEHKIDKAMQLLRSFFSSIPYNAERQDEDHYKIMFYFIFRLASAFNVRTEECSAAGRCDALVETADAIYVFEFKLKGTAQEALTQIDEKSYLIPYQAGNKKLYKIGACFDEQLRTLKDWLIKEN